MMNNKVQVSIASQQPLFVQGIKHSLSHAPDIEVLGVGQVSSDLLAAIETSPPDVALVDIDGFLEDGLALAHKIRLHSPNIGVIVLTSNPSDAQLFQVLRAQAAAYLGKDVSADQLIDVVRRVARGEHPINESVTTRPKVAEQVLHEFQDLYWHGEGQGFISPLTRRETEILNHMGQGFLNKQIAAELGISEQTIKNHVTSILRKLNANARTEAVIIGIKQGLISIS